MTTSKVGTLLYLVAWLASMTHDGHVLVSVSVNASVLLIISWSSPRRMKVPRLTEPNSVKCIFRILTSRWHAFFHRPVCQWPRADGFGIFRFVRDTNTDKHIMIEFIHWHAGTGRTSQGDECRRPIYIYIVKCTGIQLEIQSHEHMEASIESRLLSFYNTSLFIDVQLNFVYAKLHSSRHYY